MDKALSKLMQQVATAAPRTAWDDNAPPPEPASRYELHFRLLDIPYRIRSVASGNPVKRDAQFKIGLQNLDWLRNMGPEYYLAELHAHFAKAARLVREAKDVCEKCLERNQDKLTEAKFDSEKLENSATLLYEQHPGLIGWYENMSVFLEGRKRKYSNSVIKWHDRRRQIDRIDDDLRDLQRQLRYNPQDGQIISLVVESRLKANRPLPPPGAPDKPEL